MQEQCPIAYYNQVLSQCANIKSVYEKTFMAIVLAVQKWRLYLLGQTLHR